MTDIKVSRYNPEYQKNYRNSQRYREQDKNYQKEYRKTDKWKNSNLKRRLDMYKLSHESYEIFLEEQNYSCAICKTHISELSRSTLDIDHDHNTGIVRGLLCNSCNRGLGLFKDNVSLIMSAVKYLKKSDKKENIINNNKLTHKGD